METQQRDIFGRVIQETCLQVVASIVIDTSGTMGTYYPEDVEEALNSLFEHVSASNDTDDCVRLSVYDAHDDSELLGGFSKASDFFLRDIRPGGSWGLPGAIALATNHIIEYCATLQTLGFVHAIPLVIVLSDNPASEQDELYAPLDNALEESRKYPSIVHPRYLLASSRDLSPLAHHLPDPKIIKVEREKLQPVCRALAVDLGLIARDKSWQEVRNVL